MIKKVTLTFLGLVFSLSVLAQSEIPQIVIEPKGHSGKILKILFTPDGKRLISISEDKSIRVWQTNTGKLLSMHKSQIGNGPEGMFYASALSPNGKVLAVSGYPVVTEAENYIVFLDIDKGEQIAVAKGHTDVINSLDFSGDGNYMASGSNDGNVMLWNTSNLESPVIAATINTGTAVTSLSFNPKNLGLAVTNESKEISLYNLNGIQSGKTSFSPKMLKKHKDYLKTVRFSPDGRYLASSDFQNQLILWDKNGDFIKEIDKTENSFNTLTFSHDGKILVAMEDVKGVGRSYSIPSGSKFSDFEGHDNTAYTADFSPTSLDGNYLVASAGGSNNEIFIWNAINGRKQKSIKGQGRTVWDLSFGAGLELYVSHTSVEPGGRNNYHVSFDFENFVIRADSNYTGGGIASGNRNSDLKQIDAYTLQLEKGKFLQVDANSDGRILEYIETNTGNIIIAADYSLKAFNKNGAILREYIGHTSGVRAIAISKDGRYLVSGSEDQTIKLWKLNDEGEVPSIREVFSEDVWHKYFAELPLDSLTFKRSRKAWDKVIGYLKSKDDKTYRDLEEFSAELIANVEPRVSLFISADKEWIAWVPSGYFSCSSKGSQYFGWHVNNGVHKLANFYSAEQYFDILYRPEILPKSVKEGKKVEDIMKEQGERIFDLTKLDKPSAAFFNTTVLTLGANKTLDYEAGHYNTQQKELSLEVDYYDGGGGVKEINIYQNEKLIISDKEIDQGQPGKKRIKNYKVQVLNGINTFKVVALNYQKIESIPDMLEIKYTGEVVPTSDLYILTVGINEYKNSQYNLNYAHSDAKSFTDVLVKNSKKIFKNVKRFEFYDFEATKSNIVSGFDLIKSQAKPEDVFVFYYAGHGTLEDNDIGEEEYFLVPSDVTKLYGDSQQLMAKGIRSTELRDILGGVKPQKQLILLDACNSGAAAKSFNLRAAASEEKAIVQLARSAGVVLIAASGTQQFAAEVDELKHGVFTYALLEALEGKADKGRDGKVTVAELKAYMDDRVPELSEKYAGRSQYPTGFSQGQDFPISFLE